VEDGPVQERQQALHDSAQSLTKQNYKSAARLQKQSNRPTTTVSPCVWLAWCKCSCEEGFIKAISGTETCSGLWRLINSIGGGGEQLD
jgi:hypothetical protein